MFGWPFDKLLDPWCDHTPLLISYHFCYGYHHHHTLVECLDLHSSCPEQASPVKFRLYRSLHFRNCPWNDLWDTRKEDLEKWTSGKEDELNLAKKISLFKHRLHRLHKRAACSLHVVLTDGQEYDGLWANRARALDWEKGKSKSANTKVRRTSLTHKRSTHQNRKSCSAGGSHFSFGTRPRNDISISNISDQRTFRWVDWGLMHLHSSSIFPLPFYLSFVLPLLDKSCTCAKRPAPTRDGKIKTSVRIMSFERLVSVSASACAQIWELKAKIHILQREDNR